MESLLTRRQLLKRYQKGNLSKIVAPCKNMLEQNTPKNHWVSSRIVISKGGIHGIWMDVSIMNRDDIIISLSKLGSIKTLEYPSFSRICSDTDACARKWQLLINY